MRWKWLSASELWQCPRCMTIKRNDEPLVCKCSVTEEVIKLPFLLKTEALKTLIEDAPYSHLDSKARSILLNFLKTNPSSTQLYDYLTYYIEGSQLGYKSEWFKETFNVSKYYIRPEVIKPLGKAKKRVTNEPRTTGGTTEGHEIVDERERIQALHQEEIQCDSGDPLPSNCFIA